MHHHYEDILSRISEPPKWWDENGTPRFSEFSPRDVSYIYADEVVLMLIGCQSCDTEFEVAMSYGASERTRSGYSMFQAAIFENPPKDRRAAENLHTEAFEAAWKMRLADLIAHRALHYGDPPNTHCCPAGATMNSVPKRVLQYWSRDMNGASGKRRFDWERDPTLEVDITPDWAKT